MSTENIALSSIEERTPHFFGRQWSAIKYLFSIETALIYFV